MVTVANANVFYSVCSITVLLFFQCITLIIHVIKCDTVCSHLVCSQSTKIRRGGNNMKSVKDIVTFNNNINMNCYKNL